METVAHNQCCSVPSIPDNLRHIRRNHPGTIRNFHEGLRPGIATGSLNEPLAGTFDGLPRLRNDSKRPAKRLDIERSTHRIHTVYVAGAKTDLRVNVDEFT